MIIVILGYRKGVPHMLKDIIYPALFVKHADEDGYAVIFPDILFAVTSGETVEEAFEMGTELLTMLLYDEFAEGKELPQPSPHNSISYEKYCREVLEEEPRPVAEWFTSFVKTRFLAREFNEKVLRVNCTMPSSLKYAAERAGLNFSQILQKGLKDALAVYEK
jgi:predicted RNase H-like HicB family nuclease